MKSNYQSTKEIEIKIGLLLARTKQIDIARKLGISKQYINCVIKGQRHTTYVRKAIAKAAGKRIEDLWPSSPSKKAA